MVRKLKHHEQKLLRKVDFVTYPTTATSHRDSAVIRRYSIQKPSDYSKYNRICGSLRQLAHRLSNLEVEDPVRKKMEEALLEKLWAMGILATGGGGRGKLSDVERKVSVSAFARRRLGVVLTRLRMAESVPAVSGLFSSPCGLLLLLLLLLLLVVTVAVIDEDDKDPEVLTERFYTTGHQIHRARPRPSRARGDHGSSIFGHEVFDVLSIPCFLPSTIPSFIHPSIYSLTQRSRKTGGQLH
jgi:hypothetical protein